MLALLRRLILSERGQAGFDVVIILLGLLVLFLVVAGMYGAGNCAITMSEYMHFWVNHCDKPIQVLITPVPYP